VELNYENDLKIDADALDVEWVRQPEIARRYIKHAAWSRRRERKAEEQMKIIRSELVRKANDDPKGCTGKDKPTTLDIEAFYRTHPDHILAKQNWIDAAYEADYADMARQEISWGRKAALENLVVLHGANYFAGPSAPRNLSKEWEQKRRQEIADNIVDSSMKRKK